MYVSQMGINVLLWNQGVSVLLWHLLLGVSPCCQSYQERTFGYLQGRVHVDTVIFVSASDSVGFVLCSVVNDVLRR